MRKDMAGHVMWEPSREQQSIMIGLTLAVIGVFMTMIIIGVIFCEMLIGQLVVCLTLIGLYVIVTPSHLCLWVSLISHNSRPKSGAEKEDVSVRWGVLVLGTMIGMHVLAMTAGASSAGVVTKYLEWTTFWSVIWQIVIGLAGFMIHWAIWLWGILPICKRLFSHQKLSKGKE